MEVVETADWDLVFDLQGRFSADDPNDMKPMGREAFDALATGRTNAFIAYDGQRPVGVALLMDLDGATALNAFTGVERAARGRGIAKLLKLNVIARARRNGVSRLVTQNNSQNAPMLKVNQWLGYDRRPGVWILRNPTPTAAP